MNHDIFSRWADISAPVHGGTPLDAEISDFSISINPFPLPRSVGDAYAAAWDEIGCYPDTSCLELTNAVSACFGIPTDRLLITNGSAEAFSLIASVFLGPGKKAMVIIPGYSDYEHVSKLTGADILYFRLKSEDGFEPGSELINEIRLHKPDLIWLCSPNNPTGTVTDRKLIDCAAEAAAAYGGFVVLDEAYAAFSCKGQTEVWAADRKAEVENIITVRSLTKDFGVPGLRLGYISGAAEAVRILNLHKPCWSISGPAQSAGAALLNEIDYFKNSWRETEVLQRELIGAMQRAGVDPLDAAENSCGIFVFFKTPQTAAGHSFAELMLEQGVRVRDCSSMGAPGYCRIGVKQQQDNHRFLKALEAVSRKRIINHE